MEDTKKNYPLIAGIIILVVAIALFGAFKYIKKDTAVTEIPNDTNTVPTETSTSTSGTTGGTVVTSKYKDGTYSATGDYNSPGGAEQVAVQITLSNDVITDATVQSLATRPESIQFQGKFISGIKSIVVGKKIDDVSVSKVSGSSLTSRGFNDALAKIKVEAQA